MPELTGKLNKLWVYGFENLRGIDDTTYAFDFPAKSDETVQMFLTRFAQTIGRLGQSFNVVGSCLEFGEPMFAVVEFTENE